MTTWRVFDDKPAIRNDGHLTPKGLQCSGTNVTCGIVVTNIIALPKISIAIPVYNGSDYLAEAINSALSQSYKNIEIIVVNDGSNDEGKTEKLALSYGDKIRYFSKPNGGVASALNLAIEKMEGDYFSWLSHDDVYCADKLEKQVRYLKYLPENTILYSDFLIINNKSECIGHQNVFFKPLDHIRHNLICYPQMHGCSTLVPKQCFERIGLFNEELIYTQDYEFWLRASHYFHFAHVPEYLIMSRHHLGQTSVLHKSKKNKETYQLLNEYLSETTESVNFFFKNFPEVFISQLWSKNYDNCNRLLEDLVNRFGGEESLSRKLVSFRSLSLSSFFTCTKLPYLFLKYKITQNYIAFTRSKRVSYRINLPSVVREKKI